MIRGSYTPLREGKPGKSPASAPMRVLTADEMLRRYCGEVYAQTGSYHATATLLDIDRRTVKKYVIDEGRGIDEDAEN